jgi:hypothetical protein
LKSRLLLSLAGALAFSAAIPQTARAGDIELYEIATPDVGLAQRKVGEKVVFRHTEMIALSVQKS